MSKKIQEAMQNIVVNGVIAKDVDMSKFSSNREMSDWAGAYWEEFVRTFSDEESKDFQTLEQVFGAQFFSKWNIRRAEIDEAEFLAKPVRVDGKDYKAIKAFDILYSGWECDGKGWIVQTDEGNKIVLTNHGQAYFAHEKELREHLSNYAKAISDTEAAIALLGDKKDN